VLCKYGSNGDLVWVQQVTGNTPSGWVGIDDFADGSFVVSGEFQGDLTFGTQSFTGTGNADAFLARFAPNGSLVWVRTIGSAAVDRGHGVTTTSGGDVLWCGEFSGTVSFGANQSLTASGGTDMFVACCSGSGAFAWADRAGGTQNDAGQAVEVAPGGNVLVSGMYSYSAVFGGGSAKETNVASAGSDDVFVAKWYDPNVEAIPPSLVVPESITQECDDQSRIASVEFSVEVDGTLPKDAQLRVRDVTADRVLYAGPATVGVTDVGPDGFPIGVSRIEVTLLDGGQPMLVESFDVTVQDTTAPVLSGCGPKTVELEGPLTALTRSRLGITATDDCDAAPVVTLSPTQVPLGVTQVTATARDETGNVSRCTFPVTIVDTTSPWFDVTQNDIERIGASSGGVVVGFDVVASDLSGSVTLSFVDETGRSVLPSGSLYVPGIHTVTCTAVDGSGNRAVDTFEIRIVEDQDPVLEVPDDIVVGNEPGEAFAHVSWTIVVTDDTAGVSVQTTAGGGPVASGDAFPIGATTITCVATDRAGNTVTDSFQIIVQDREAPTATVEGSTEFRTSEDSVTLTPQLLDLSVQDNYDPNPVVMFSPSTVGVGTTDVTCTVCDADGNSSIDKLQVTVVKSTLTVEVRKSCKRYRRFHVGRKLKIELKIRDGHRRVDDATFELVEVVRVDCNGTVLGTENVASDSLKLRTGRHGHRRHRGEYKLELDTKGWTDERGTRFKISLVVKSPEHGTAPVTLLVRSHKHR